MQILCQMASFQINRSLRIFHYPLCVCVCSYIYILSVVPLIHKKKHFDDIFFLLKIFFCGSIQFTISEYLCSEGVVCRENLFLSLCSLTECLRAVQTNNLEIFKCECIVSNNTLQTD